jgi:predicted nucleotidyltransferase
MIKAIIEHKQKLQSLCQRFNVKSLDVFGSALSEKTFDKHKSDIDFLVEFEPMEAVQHAKSYFGLLQSLQDMLSCRIDLIEIKAVHNPYFLDSINKSRSQIYAA